MKNVEKMLKKATLSVVTVLLLTALSYAQKAPKLSDAEVAHAAVTANQIDIDYAAIAKKNQKMKKCLSLPKPCRTTTGQ